MAGSRGDIGVDTLDSNHVNHKQERTKHKSQNGQEAPDQIDQDGMQTD